MKKSTLMAGILFVSIIVYSTIFSALQGELVNLKNHLDQLESSLEKFQKKPLLQKSKFNITKIPYATNFNLEVFKNLNFIEENINIPFERVYIFKNINSPLLLYIDFGTTERIFHQIKGSIDKLKKSQKHVPYKFIIFLKNEGYPSLNQKQKEELKLEEENIRLFILDFGFIGGKRVILDSEKNKKALKELKIEIDNIISSLASL